MDIKIRKLRVSDRKRLAQLIEKMVNKVGDQSITNMISSAAQPSKVNESADSPHTDNEDRSGKMMQVGITILKSLLSTLEDETHAWFAELINVSKEDFLELPLDTEAVIIEQMVTAKETDSFFIIASRLHNKITLLRDKFSEMRG